MADLAWKCEVNYFTWKYEQMIIIVVQLALPNYFVLIWDERYLAIQTHRVKHKYVLGPTQTHFSPSRYVRVLMSSERGPKYIYAQENKLYFYYHFGGYFENKNWKKNSLKQSEEYSFHQRCTKTSTTLRYILASQILHFSP